MWRLRLHVVVGLPVSSYVLDCRDTLASVYSTALQHFVGVQPTTLHSTVENEATKFVPSFNCLLVQRGVYQPQIIRDVVCG